MPPPDDMTAQAFYRARDARTTLSAGADPLATGRVAISIDDREAETLAGQLAFLLSVNLTARWCRSTTILARETSVHPGLAPFADGPLREAALAIAQAADPFGDFRITDAPETERVAFHIGIDPPAGAYPVQGRGWMAFSGPQLARTPAPGDSDNPLGGAFAACIGAAYAFRRSLGHSRQLPSDCRLSLWNLRGGARAVDGPTLEHAELGRLAIIGVGAVGSTIAYLLPLVASPALVALIERDVIDLSNLNRAPLFLAKQVGLPKVRIVEAYLRAAGCTVHAIEKWFDEAVDAGEIALHEWDIVVPAANERGVRHTIAYQLPPLQVYGTTGPNWDAFMGRHIPLKEDCLACRFPAPETAPTFACATGDLQEIPAETGPDAVTGALPFLSTAAAILACAELAKLPHPTYPLNANFVSLGFRGPLLDFLPVQLPPVPGCPACPGSSVWFGLTGHTRFAGFSR